VRIPNDAYVVVVEFDCSDHARRTEPNGPLVWETYLPQTREQAECRAGVLGHSYGRTVVCKLVPVAHRQSVFQKFGLFLKRSISLKGA
jgi:hypothetical protein